MKTTVIEANAYGFNNAIKYAFIKHQLCAWEGENETRKT